jgi:hypothetical protein
MAGICNGWISCAYDYFIDGEFPGNKGSDCQPGEELKNRVIIELGFLGIKSLAGLSIE